MKEDKGNLEVTFDNANARALGKERVVLSGGLVSPFRQGEVISLNSLYSEGSFFRGLSVSFPLEAKG